MKFICAVLTTPSDDEQKPAVHKARRTSARHSACSPSTERPNLLNRACSTGNTNETVNEKTNELMCGRPSLSGFSALFRHHSVDELTLQQRFVCPPTPRTGNEIRKSSKASEKSSFSLRVRRRKGGRLRRLQKGRNSLQGFWSRSKLLSTKSLRTDD